MYLDVVAKDITYDVSLGATKDLSIHSKMIVYQVTKYNVTNLSLRESYNVLSF